MTELAQRQIKDLVENADDVQDPQSVNASPELEKTKPKLLVDPCNPDQSVQRMRDLFTASGILYDRGMPVRVVYDQIAGGMIAQIMTPDGLVLMAHQICRPIAKKVEKGGSQYEDEAALPRNFAVMYLAWRGEWNLPPLNGIATSPLLKADGTIRSADGYDQASGMWCEKIPNLEGLVPEKPTREQAVAALSRIRQVFRTFPFADAAMVLDDATDIAMVDPDVPPGLDESSFLAALLTAVCRPSLGLAPGLLLRAPPISGAGTGKGLLARCICLIAFGREPSAVTAGAESAELEKRIAAELMEGSPALFLDNLNNHQVKSDLLASAITERPSRVRILGKSTMVTLNASAFVVLTGNGLSVSEDLARRFIAVDLDAHTEDPEARKFRTNIRREVTERRADLLAALLTIWRWGRTTPNIKAGLQLGSFEEWARWVRDPLLALDCEDPVARVGEAKARDGGRQFLSDLFTTWWGCHQGNVVTASQLHDNVRQIIDHQNRGRQYVAAKLSQLAGTRIAGFVLTRQGPAGTWSAATYLLKRASDLPSNRTLRDNRSTAQSDEPYASYDDRTAVDLPEDGLIRLPLYDSYGLVNAR